MKKKSFTQTTLPANYLRLESVDSNKQEPAPAADDGLDQAEKERKKWQSEGR